MPSRSPRRRPAVVTNEPLLRIPPGYFGRPARLVWRDGDFLEIREAVSRFYASVHRTLSDPTSDEYGGDTIPTDDFRVIAGRVLDKPAETVRDIFLRGELLTMHYGHGQLAGLLEGSPHHRMLGELVRSVWKVGGAANV